jgi:hypothetical protein
MGANGDLRVAVFICDYETTRCDCNPGLPIPEEYIRLRKKDPHMAGLFMNTTDVYFFFMISFFLLSYSFSVMMPAL